MKNAELAPYKVLFCIADTKVSQQILDYLNTHKETMHDTCLAEGTRRLGILQMLGVGKIDRHLILGIIRTSTASQTLKDLDTILMPDGGHCCLKMTDNCYGCGCYSTGNYKHCNERIKSYFSKLEE